MIDCIDRHKGNAKASCQGTARGARAQQHIQQQQNRNITITITINITNIIDRRHRPVQKICCCCARARARMY